MDNPPNPHTAVVSSSSLAIEQNVFQSNASPLGQSQFGSRVVPVFGSTFKPNAFSTSPTFSNPFGAAVSSTTSNSLIGNTSSSNTLSRSPFGNVPSTRTSVGDENSPSHVFGSVASPSPGSLFKSTTDTSSGSMFGNNSSFPSSTGIGATATTSSNLFGNFAVSSSTAHTVTASSPRSMFATATATSSVFGTGTSSTNSSSSGLTNPTSSSSSLPASSSNTLFRNQFTSPPSTSSSSGILFGKSTVKPSISNAPPTSSPPGFGDQAKNTNLFASGNQQPYQSKDSGLVFGSRLKTDNNSSSSSSNPSPNSGSTSTQSSLLFGKPHKPPLTGSSVSESGENKASSATATLFGKPVKATGPQSASSSVTSFSAFQGHESPSNETGLQKDENEDLGEDEERAASRKSIGRWKSSPKTAAGARHLVARRRSLLTSRPSDAEPSDDAVPSNSLVVRNIPAHYCDREILRKHFSRYGRIRFIRATPEKLSAAVTFDSKESAFKAKEATYIDDESPPMDIFFRSSPQGLVSKRSNTKISLRDSTRKRTVSQGVEDELKSMAELPEFETEPVTFSKAASSKPQRPAVTRRRSPTPPPPRHPSPAPQPTFSTPQDNAADLFLPPDLDSVKGLLKVLYQSKGSDINEKIAVLDKRDELLKLLRGREQSNLASAKAFVGKCPDMCPEKERYYREDTRRLALYEVILSTMSSVTGIKTKVDHAKAVKEYSRSSADQKEPLPHELRPLSVLKSTMVYLLTNIADEGGEGKWSEWYDYLWNRTRGIRKDITQQQLCHIDVAHLLEQCVRFHIFCSERLCEEDMMTFDDKINNENLTKCLQTLKELYEDLEMKDNCYCPNEAEIRSYIVVMNINQGDTLREIQQLRPEIRDSPFIQFAVDCYNAVNSCNYVRFFRLIKKATFLNSCILHRYFNQIRSKALRIIKKAMTTQGKSVSYPVSEMIRLLCFENASEVVEFCSHYGLRVEGSAIILDGPSIIEPEGSVPQRRSVTLVESKRTISVGETIYGGPLPHVDLPTPHSSFDANGQFIFTPEFLKDLVSAGLKIPPQIGEMLAKGGTLTEQIIPPVVPENKKLPLARDAARTPYSNEAIKSAARALILEETDSQAVSVAKEVLEREEMKQACLNDITNEILQASVIDSVKSVANEVIESEEQELRHALELANHKRQCMDKTCDILVEEVLGDLVKDVLNEEWKLVEEERYRLNMVRCSQDCADTLVELVTTEQIADLASEIHQVEVVAKRERLARTEAQILHNRMLHSFQMWHKSYMKRQRVKRAMLDFPVAPPNRSQSEQLSALVPVRPTNRITGKSFYVGERAKLTVRSPMDILYQDLHLSASLSMASAKKMLMDIKVWQPLDIGATTCLQLASRMQEWKDCNVIERNASYIQWKLVLSTPNRKANCGLENFLDWTQAKFGQKLEEKKDEDIPSAEGEIFCKYTTHLSPPQSQVFSLSFCVRCFYGNWNDTHATNAAKKEVLKGMSGLVFITSDAEKFLSDETFWKKDRIRFEQLLTKKSKSPAVPVVIFIPRQSLKVSVSSDVLAERLQLNRLQGQGLVSAVHFAQPYVAVERVTTESSAEWNTQLSNCVRFLAARIPSPPCLAIKALADYVEDGVVEFYKAPVYQDLRTRTGRQLLHQSPNMLLSLYNDVVDHLAMVIASDTLTTCSWPAPEFDQESRGLKSHWNSQEHLCNVYELMSKLRLPFFRYSDMESPDWSIACNDVWKYLENVTRKDSGSPKLCLYQKVVDLVQSTKKRFDKFCWQTSEEGALEPTYVNMAWTDLIDACIRYKMVSLRTGHFRLREPEKDSEGELEEDDFEDFDVYYDQSELQEYEAPSVWEEALRVTDTAASAQIKETIEVTSGMKRIHSEVGEEDNDTIGKKRHRGCGANQEEDTIGKKGLAGVDSTIEQRSSFIQDEENTDPALKNLSDRCFDMLQSEKEASLRFEKVLASLSESAVNTPSFATPSLSVGIYHRTQKHFSSVDGTPKSRFKTADVSAIPAVSNSSRETPLLGNSALRTDRTRTSYATGRGIMLAEDEIVNENKEGERGTISDKLKALKEEVEREKKIDTLFEMRLRQLTTDFNM